MRKKALFDEINKVVEKNNILFEKCSALQKELEAKECELIELKDKFKQLETENAELLVKLEETANISVVAEESDTLAETINNDASLEDDGTDASSDYVEDGNSDKDGDSDVKMPDNHSDVSDVEDNNRKLNSKYIANGALDIASEAIGRVVLKCASVCNEFTANGNHNAKDLVNLALGRTEVFKSEVLALVSDDISIEMLTAQINAKEIASMEYFEILINQL
ncbi:MAG: hypothetical protein J6Q76_02395 [Clostridia bacterium]|nr:hypothetical protein [Clostridia bacterium]